MNFITPFLLPYMAIFSSPVFAIFTMLSFWQAWQGVQLGRGLWAERHKVWQEPLTAEKMRRLDSAAFLLAIPPTVFIHELGHAIAVWVFGGRVLEFGFFFFLGLHPARPPIRASPRVDYLLGGHMGELIVCGRVGPALVPNAILRFALLCPPRRAPANLLRPHLLPPLHPRPHFWRLAHHL
ncbi:MAG: hypothetical protein IPL28_18815 [Chloroflexi bacterium]|nr:hypothetical protein [Chloroflexota bacterium]